MDSEVPVNSQASYLNLEEMGLGKDLNAYVNEDFFFYLGVFSYCDYGVLCGDMYNH